MDKRELSKLQIRAEVLMILQHLSGFDEIPKEEEDKYLAQLKSIQNIDDVVEVLAKELVRVDLKKGQIISLYLLELGNLEQVKDTLWSYIKDPSSSDELKDLSNIILRGLGDTSDPEEFLNYLDDPKAVVDKETQKLLEVAAINPEAQIDFLDFLFSLPEPEQINLVKSLKEDYSGEYIANILIPALESRSSANLEDILVETLGETRSLLAVPVLQDLVEFSNSERTKKLAKKSLNMLKLSGINIDDPLCKSRGAEICEISDIYECYSNYTDGIGSQGLIISRKKSNNDILMFSVVINDVEGIIDCFGFNGISKLDFNKIIQRFQQESTRVFVSPEYSKYKLQKAEMVNKANNYPIPYEYIAWKTLIYDFPLLEESTEATASKWGNPELADQGKILYKHPEFQHWFLEDDDHPIIKESLGRIIRETAEKAPEFIENTESFIKKLENDVTALAKIIFDENWKEVYRNRLLNVAYLLDIQGILSFRDIAASVAWEFGPDCTYPIENSAFLRELLKKTICEGFIRYQYNLDQELKPKTISAWTSRKIQEPDNNFGSNLSSQNLNDIINILCNNWLDE